jgi:hypothetical protein
LIDWATGGSAPRVLKGMGRTDAIGHRST